MNTAALYGDAEPERAAVNALTGSAVIEFGAPWCGYCQGAQSIIDAAFADHGSVPHLRIEDGKGRRLGRSFQVKLWPTLIFLRDGREVTRLVRPADANEIKQALLQITR